MFDEVGKIIWGRFSGSQTPWFLKLVYIFRFNVIIVTNMLWYRESYELGKGRIIQEYVQKAYDDKESNWLAIYNPDDNTALSRPEYEGAKFPWMLLLLLVAIALYLYKGRK